MIKVSCDLIESATVASLDDVPGLFREYGETTQRVEGNKIILFQKGEWLGEAVWEEADMPDSVGTIITYNNKWYEKRNDGLWHELVGTIINRSNKLYEKGNDGLWREYHTRNCPIRNNFFFKKCEFPNAVFATDFTTNFIKSGYVSKLGDGKEYVLLRTKIDINGLDYGMGWGWFGIGDSFMYKNSRVKILGFKDCWGASGIRFLQVLRNGLEQQTFGTFGFTVERCPDD